MSKKRIVLPKFDVRPGCIDINSIRVDVCSDDCISFTIDTKQKYPTSEGYSTNPYAFYFGADERTLGLDKRQQPTRLDTMLIVRGCWVKEEHDNTIKMVCDTHRYGFRCTLIRVGVAKQVNFKKVER